MIAARMRLLAPTGPDCWDLANSGRAPATAVVAMAMCRKSRLFIGTPSFTAVCRTTPSRGWRTLSHFKADRLLALSTDRGLSTGASRVHDGTTARRHDVRPGPDGPA